MPFIYIIRIATRKLLQRPVIGALKVGGLAVSIAIVIVMLQFVSFQWNFDQFHEKKDRIYRVVTSQYADKILNVESAMTYAGIGPLLNTSFPEVEKTVRLAIWIGNDVVIQHGEKAVREQNFFYAEPSFFDVFSFELLAGDPNTALSKPHSIVLTQDIADRLFGDENPIGKIVRHENRQSLTVTGIIAQPPQQSHLQFGMLASYDTWNGSGMDGEGVYGDQHFHYFYTYTYALLHPEAKPAEIAQKLTATVGTRKNLDLHTDVFRFQPLSDIHLYSNLSHEMQATGNGKNLWTLLAIALIILVLAWFNYFNIATAGTLDQSKAIGVRKVIGASRSQVLRQLFIENICYSLFAAIAAGILVGLLSQPLAHWLGSPIGNIFSGRYALFGPITLVLTILALGTILTALLPALTMASFRPVWLFSRSFHLAIAGIGARKGLVVLQFMIIIGLLAASMVIVEQSRYMNEKDPGIDLANILTVKGPLGTAAYENLQPAHQAFRERLKRIPGVRQIAMTDQIPGNDLDLIDDFRHANEDRSYSLSRMWVTPSFFQLYRLPLLAGDSLRIQQSNRGHLLLNEAAMRLMGFSDPEQAIGSKVTYYGDSESEIIGIVKNHHHYSLHQPVAPIAFFLMNDGELEDGFFSLKMEGTDYPQHLPAIEAAFKASFPDTVFEYFDMEAKYREQYRADDNFRRLNLAFTGIAFFIACMGLLALSLIIVEKRIVEIGIRKILGSSVAEILLLLSRDFLTLVLIGWMLAIPVTWYCLQIWLQNFAFRVEITWWIFPLAGLAAIAMIVLSTGINALKAALLNPATILKSE